MEPTTDPGANRGHDSDGIVAELTAVLREAAEAQGAPGAVTGVLVGDRSHVASYGVTSVEHPQALDARSLFQVGSISKTFTSAAVMVLVQEGKVALDDPVSRHLPDLAAATGLDLDSITVEHTLSHQSGFDGDHLFVDRETHDLAALADARRMFAPGTGFSYSNAGFSIAGAVIEAASRQTFESFVRTRLLLPLGMTSASFRADDAITHQVAMPHWLADGEAFVLRRLGWQPGWELGPVDRAAAGLIASVDHLLAWCRFQRTGLGLDGGVVLTPESLDRLHTPVVNANLLEDIGLDWFVEQPGGCTAIGHGGVTAGYVSDLVIVPDHELGIVTLTNATNGGAVNQVVRRWALDRFAGIVERDPEPDPSLVVDPARFAGRYVHSFAELVVTAGPMSGTVVVTPERRQDDTAWQPPLDPPVTYAFFSADHAVSVDESGPARVIRFGFEPGSDRASWVLSGSRRAPRQA